MKKTKFQRITALLLALVFLFCGSAVAVGAEESSTTNKTTSDIKALLNAISYDEYVAQHAEVPRGENELVIDATENCEFVTTAGTKVTPEERELPDRDSDDYAAEAIKDVPYVARFDGVKGLYTPASGTTTWTLDEIDTATKYSIEILYYPIENKSASIERILKINGEVPFSEARYLTISKVWKNVYDDGTFEVPEGESAATYIAAAEKVGIKATEGKDDDGKAIIIYTMPDYWTEETAALVDEQVVRFFTTDIDLNEIRSSLVQAPVWTTYVFKDSNGFMQDSFEFVISPDEETGKVTISLEAVNEPLVISEIRLVPYEAPMTYEEYLKAYDGEPDGEGKIKIEAEYYSAASSQTIYPVSDTTSAVTSPAATNRTVLNTIGGEKWQTAGQWLEYTFKVDSSGMYNVATRFKQNILDGMYTSRALYVYSDASLSEGDRGYYNGLPFEEAGRLRFNYSSDWQSGMLTDGENSFELYFAEGVEYTLRFEVTLGSMGSIVSRVQSSLDSINADYLNIVKLTGSNPDEYRDYGFSRVMPDTMIDMIIQSRELYAIAEELASIADVKSSMTATLEKVARLLAQMGKDDDEVAKNLEQLKTYIGSLGTWLSDAKTQPLTLDYIVVQSASDAELPKANAGFFKALAYEISSFFQSFFRNYNRMGALVDVEETDAVEVWLAYGRDQTQVIRSLINNDFTPHTGVTIDLKLVSGGTLLPSILAGMGPDVYIGIGQGDVINYAIRGALAELEDLEGFDEALSDFNEAAMMVLGIEDSKGEMHYYGLPETQSFSMMFVREDIFADLGLDIPKTWDDVKECIPVLQANNMQIAMHSDVNIFLYQMGGELFADNGMRINLDSNVALDAFNTMCEMFTMYSFPYKYDFANRFRTGEMPLGFADYTGTYNQLKVFATEIEGLWGFYPMPGYADEETGEINNVAVSSVSAISIITGCENIDGAWAFTKWHVDDQCQIDYSNEMVAILGPSAKHATANMSALESLPWTAEEYEQLSLQFNKLAAIPNYPGRYIVDRYTKFAFLAAYNDNADPVTELQSYITTINTEITRKREEFELETLESGQTLAQKRMLEAETEINAVLKDDPSYEAACSNVLSLIKGYGTEDYASLRAFADDLEELNSELFAVAAAKLRSAAASLESYEAYK